MKNFVFIFILLLCFTGLFLGSLWNQFHPIETRLSDQIRLHTLEGEEIVLSKQTELDTVLFSGYRSCTTICTNTLPILEGISVKYNHLPPQVIFLDLSLPETKFGALQPKNFPHVKWIVVPHEKREFLLTKLNLERASNDHHSSRVLLHRGNSETMEVVENFSLRRFEDWIENRKKSLSSLSK